MKICSKCKLEKPFEAFTKDKQRSDGYYPSCKSCRKAASTYQKGNAKRREYHKQYYKANKDYIDAQQATYKEQNKDKVAKSIRNWQINNPDKVNAYAAKRRAHKKECIVDLIPEELNQIKAFYLEATKLTVATGVIHEVDHIIPLSCKYLGLHHPCNMQVITREENRKKGNTFNSDDLLPERVKNKHLLKKE